MFVPLQDGTESPAGLHRCLQLTQRVVGQQRHRDVIKQPLTQCLEERNVGKIPEEKVIQFQLVCEQGSPAHVV